MLISLFSPVSIQHLFISRFLITRTCCEHPENLDETSQGPLRQPDTLYWDDFLSILWLQSHLSNKFISCENTFKTTFSCDLETEGFVSLIALIYFRMIKTYSIFLIYRNENQGINLVRIKWSNISANH